MLRGTVWAMLVALTIAVGGCSSSHVIDSWRNPDFAGPIAFKKTVALVIHPDGTVRRAAEDELVRQIDPDGCAAAYQVVTEDERNDVNKLKAKLRNINADGVVTMRIVGSRTETTWIPGSGGREQFYSYYDRATVATADHGGYQTDRIVRVEIKIYSVADEKLIWSGISETFSPSEVESAVRDIAKAVGKELRKEKLLI